MQTEVNIEKLLMIIGEITVENKLYQQKVQELEQKIKSLEQCNEVYPKAKNESRPTN